MKLRRLCTLLALASFASATAAEAAIHRVDPNDDVQAVIDGASPGDTILFEPGVYMTSNPRFGLHITTDNLRLIGRVKRRLGEAGKVRLVHTGTQETGVYAAPGPCPPELGVGECPVANLQGFEIRNFSVEGFPGNGIQTRFVTGFKMIRNISAGNLNNGIYPTISANGLVRNNVSYGALDTAAWVAASENVRVVGNEFFDSVIGFEITVSNNVDVVRNDIHDNTVGVGLFHPNAAGNAQLPVMEDWVIRNNDIYDNNAPNAAAAVNPALFQAGLPSGVGILALGVSGHRILWNDVDDHDFVGIGLLGWCSATATNPARNCFADPPQADPSVNDNRIAWNRVRDNGLNPPVVPPFDAINFLAADLTYFSAFPVDPPGPEGPETSSGNCFVNNRPNGLTSVSSEADGLLPTDGC